MILNQKARKTPEKYSKKHWNSAYPGKDGGGFSST